MKTKKIPIEEEISDVAKIQVWNWQIKKAMPDFKQLHLVGETLFKILVDKKMMEAVHEVRTDNGWVGFHVLFHGTVFGTNLKELMEYVVPSWIDVKDGFTSMTFNSDDFRKAYPEER